MDTSSLLQAINSLPAEHQERVRRTAESLKGAEHEAFALHIMRLSMQFEEEAKAKESVLGKMESLITEAEHTVQSSERLEKTKEEKKKHTQDERHAESILDTL